MGSFANSLHVRSNDSKRVADVLARVLADAGYVPTNKEPKLGPFQANTGPQRAVVVCEAHGGWVGVLDSDLMQSMGLGSELSRRLNTYAIHFFVNDSDAWTYALYQSGTQLDEFDSSGGFDDDDVDFDDGDEDDVVPGGPTISAAEWPAMQQKLNERMAEQQQKMFAQMPPDLRDIQQKMQRGAASREEMQKYTQSAQAQAAEIMRNLSDIIPGATQFAERLTEAKRPTPPRGDDPKLDEHLKMLRPLLAAGVSDEQVLETLGREAVFAEETLAEFLPLLGIAPLFANLSYPYLSELGDAELRADNVEVAQRLKYEAAAALSR